MTAVTPGITERSNSRERRRLHSTTPNPPSQRASASQEHRLPRASHTSLTRESVMGIAWIVPGPATGACRPAVGRTSRCMAYR
jgi:hypothetical protein